MVPHRQRSTLWLRGTLFSTNMIIREKRVPFEKRVLFVAIVPQGYCFSTLFSLSVPQVRLDPRTLEELPQDFGPHHLCSFVYVGHLYYHIVLRYIVSNLNLKKGGYSCHMIFMECFNGWYLVSCVCHFLKYSINNYGIYPNRVV